MKFFRLFPAHIGFLLFILLIALRYDVTRAGHAQDAETSRQFSGLSGNPFASQTPPPPPTFNHINSLNEKKEANRKKDYSEKDHNRKDARILDRYDYRYPDGSYEYRYELADGTARYERGYFLLYDKRKALVVLGYYAYRLPDGRYLTVFYNADQNGYRQNQSITSQSYPNLPRSIEVPRYKSLPADGADYEETTATTKTTTTSGPRRGAKATTTKRGVL